MLYDNYKITKEVALEDNSLNKGKVIGLLQQIEFPTELRGLDKSELPALAKELRQELINIVSKTGGHLGANLGVVELSVALHYVFNTPEDRLIWDVGHQSYPHKILTGRKADMHSLRQGGGISGFTKRDESIYDAFGAGHSSTSISAGLGMAVARDLKKKLNTGGNRKGEDRNIICVIGDGAMSAGMAYEAMNNAGAMKNKLIAILNDNDMSISKPVGAMSAYLSKIISSKPYRNMRELGKKITSKLPEPLKETARKAEEYARGMVTGGTLFEELGFYYIGPIDGHNLEHLIPILENVRDTEQDTPILLHVVTKKGCGYEPAELANDKMHGVSCFDITTGIQEKNKSKAPSYTKVFSSSLLDAAEKDKNIVAITAAMPHGTGLEEFRVKYPDRYFDVGIAEQHAVTFAAGLAAEGMKPFVAIYSTFLQRAYDQIIHDVALQKLPVRFAIDRAGLVGADGQTHAGAFDIAYLGCIPNMVLMAAANEVELMHMVKTAAEYDDLPIVFRYPRGVGWGIDMLDSAKSLEIGKGRIVKEGSKVAILSYGARLQEALKASEILDKMGISTTVADARFAKPLDVELINELVNNHQLVVTIEEGSVGGFGSLVLNELVNSGKLDAVNGNMQIRTMALPDIFQSQNTQEKQYEEAGLNALSIVDNICSALGINSNDTSLSIVK